MPPRLNIPPITRALLVTLVAQTALGFALRYRQWTKESEAETILIPYLELVPQLSLLYPWTFLTTALVENNVFTLGISAATILYAGRYLERAWPSAEFLKFLLVASLGPNALAFGASVALYALTGDMSWSLIPINGTFGLQASFLVAFSQLVPTHTVTLFKGIISLRVPRFPLLHVIGIFLLTWTPLLTAPASLLATAGFMTSWIYLRFYKAAFQDLEMGQSHSLRGDASESFAFAEFFPAPVRPPIASLSASIFSLLVSLHVCTPFTQSDVASSSRGGGFISRGAPGIARAEAERRRAKALMALDQRLHAATQKAQPPPATGPSVQVQPNTGPQQAMSSLPDGMLGGTNYTPDGEEKA